MAKKIDVLLLQPIKGLGNSGDIVPVNVAYATNVLLPQKKAKKADTATKHAYQAKQDQKAAQHAAHEDMIRAVADYLDAHPTLTIACETNETGKLYKAMTADDIATYIGQSLTLTVDPTIFAIDKKMKTVGQYDAAVHVGKSKKKFVIVLVKQHKT